MYARTDGATTAKASATTPAITAVRQVSIAVHDPRGRDGSSRGAGAGVDRDGDGPPGRLCGFAMGPVVGPRLGVRALERRGARGDCRGAPGREGALTCPIVSARDGDPVRRAPGASCSAGQPLTTRL
ncbi:hypothetical protein Dac01nite_03980 [Demequina activiva]|uniref:Uncharacterized protein n=1 Tax=Demequina activiva TaxID=1582364 RepID=A0A919Q2F0_9MICO|nr:hypothetical protein Dac01nite_03980 [Demequina activiva]